jgi:hypothetical protein
MAAGMPRDDSALLSHASERGAAGGAAGSGAAGSGATGASHLPEVSFPVLALLCFKTAS